MSVSGPRNIEFLGPENLIMDQILFKWIFLVSIELLHNPKLVQIVSYFFYWPEILKKTFGPETDEMCQFLAPETDP
jgi:hypothetical protein